MTLLLSRQIDVAEAMIYNEYAQVLEATEPRDRRALHSPTTSTSSTGTTTASRCSRTRSSPARRGSAEGNNRTSRSASSGPRSRAGSTAATTPADCVQYTTDAGQPARRRSPGLDDERGQRARLAVAARHRHARPGLLAARRSASPRTPGIIKADPSADAYDATIAEEALAGHHRHRHEGRRASRRAPSRSRRAATELPVRRSANGPAREGRPVPLSRRARARHSVAAADGTRQRSSRTTLPRRRGPNHGLAACSRTSHPPHNAARKGIIELPCVLERRGDARFQTKVTPASL